MAGMIKAVFAGMSYQSPAFLVFLFAFFCVFFLLPGPRTKIAALLLGNAFFYVFAGGMGPLVIVFGSAVVLYAVSLGMERVYLAAERNKPAELSAKQEVAFWRPRKRACRLWLLLGLCLLLSVLVYVKAGRALGWESVSHIRQLGFGRLMVPLGLSYYTLSSVGYLIDIYKRRVKCEHNFFVLLAAITFFPTIVEGPISKMDRLCGQLRTLPKFEYRRFCFGMQRMLWGLFKKLVVADRILSVTTQVFANLFDYAGVELAIALILHIFAFYADFSGCMDMVIGAAQAMGIVLEENFRQPFLSESVADFWRRWHITLFSWFRDYIYMPIARSARLRKLSRALQSRAGKQLGQGLALALPTVLVWLLTGLWHGTGKDYIAWGLYWAALMVAGTITQPYIEKLNQKLHFKTETFGWRLFRVLRTDLLYVLGGTLIVSGTTYGLHGCLYLFRQLAAESRVWELFGGGIFEHGMDLNSFLITALGMALITAVDCMKNAGLELRQAISAQPLVFRWTLWLSLMVAVMVLGQYGPGYSELEFVYRGF